MTPDIRNKWLNTILVGDVRERLRELPDGSVHMICTSPPYWGLRDYQTELLVWGGKVGCRHDWEDCVVVGQKASGQSSSLSKKRRSMDSFSSSSCGRCSAWHGHLGLEPTPDLYVQHLVDILREVRRVLRDDGTVWLNLGDTYAANRSYQVRDNKHVDVGNTRGSEVPDGLKPKDLVGIPWRVALALQADRWWLRSDVIWGKPGVMPESIDGWAWVRCRVKVIDNTDYELKLQAKAKAEGKDRHSAGLGLERPDIWAECPGCKKCIPNDGLVLQRDCWRPTKAHEYVFMLAKSDRYFGDAEAVRESWADDRAGRAGGSARHYHSGRPDGRTERPIDAPATSGRNLRSVWTIPTQPYFAAHFASFPEALVERCIKASTSEQGCCTTCGAPWVRVRDKTTTFEGGSGRAGRSAESVNAQGKWAGRQYGKNIKLGPVVHTSTRAWRPSCRCPAGDPVPCAVLDPFIGSGTVAVVAERLKRRWVGVDLSKPYADLAWSRIKLARRGVRVSASEDKNKSVLSQRLLLGDGE